MPKNGGDKHQTTKARIYKEKNGLGDFVLHLRLLRLVENTDMAVYRIYTHIYQIYS